MRLCWSCNRHERRTSPMPCLVPHQCVAPGTILGFVWLAPGPVFWQSARHVVYGTVVQMQVARWAQHPATNEPRHPQLQARGVASLLSSLCRQYSRRLLALTGSSIRTHWSCCAGPPRAQWSACSERRQAGSKHPHRRVRPGTVLVDCTCGAGTDTNKPFNLLICVQTQPADQRAVLKSPCFAQMPASQ